MKASSGLFCLLACSPLQTYGFAAKKQAFGTRTLETKLASSPSLKLPELGNDESSMANPSTAFGKPISKEMIEFNKGMVGLLKRMIFDTIFAGEDRAYARFYALETIARVPYFSYLAVLHLYETIGRWRKANYLKIHFAESWNEMHHLLIMEELGGADRFFDRFIAQHISVFYYFIVIFLYMYNPVIAYNLNEAVEEHAYLTYAKYVEDNEESLKRKPFPKVAKQYYEDGDLYMFDAFQTETCEPRRHTINSLYDVFVAIREDEKQHLKTMEFLQSDAEVNAIHDDGTCEVPPEGAWFGGFN